MQAKKAAGQGKGIDAAVLDQKNLPGKAFVQLGRQLAALARRSQQRLPDALHIARQHRVVQHIRVTVEAGGDPVAQPPLGRRWQLGGVAQRRQRRALRLHGHARTHAPKRQSRYKNDSCSCRCLLVKTLFWH